MLDLILTQECYDIHMKIVFQYFLIAGGVLLIIIGIAGLFLPIIPGLIFIALGLIVLGKKETVENWINKLPKPFSTIIIRTGKKSRIL